MDLWHKKTGLGAGLRKDGRCMKTRAAMGTVIPSHKYYQYIQTVYIYNNLLMRQFKNLTHKNPTVGLRNDLDHT
ncbi:hypothetical protein GL2_38730 [Microbulbifer sp. GL-2]|nr:hypothetical protein GL2_38730 [Microbulbifer sp. GL-2]